LNIYYKNQYLKDTNLLFHLINILKNDIYQPDIMTFITILNNIKTEFFSKILLKSSNDERIRLSC